MDTRYLCFFLLSLWIRSTLSLRYDPAFAQYNLNQNESANDPLDYAGQWNNHTYNPSPSNWRFPIYTVFLDRFVNGDPSNDNANGTVFEQDITSTQLRHGGDLKGLVDSLDYIQGIGIKGIYIAGSPFINQPWESDSYSPLDHTLLDAHFGDISEWRRAVDEIHQRGMYVILDNTVATMGDLVGFEGYLNTSAPFLPQEHPTLWKSSRKYHDFQIGETYNETCEFPRFWNETGFPVDPSVPIQFKGCYDSEFDQFGDTEAFGVFPDYRRQLTKFASVQDRLREWVPSVRAKLEHFSCIAINMLDIDGFRFDKAIQVTVDASGEFSSSLRRCARAVGKNNFFLPGEITGGNNIGSLYLGRGRQPDQWIDDLKTAVTVTNASQGTLRDSDSGAYDAAAFHYSVYRFMTRFLGMDGNLEAGFDLPANWVDSWNQMLLSNDFVNPGTGVVDPRHMYGVTNQDVFRWPAIQQGVERMILGQFVSSLLMPGIPLLLWGEEQAFYVLDNTADNYIYGRQAMSSSPAWYLHGCYTLDSAQYFHMPLEAARQGCHDVSNSWDHRDPSHPNRNIVKALFFLRDNFPVLRDGLFLQQLSNQTEFIYLPGSNGTGTETGIWSVLRSGFPGVQDMGDTPFIWLVYHNRNETTQYTFNCSSNSSALISPFPTGTRVKNLIFPHDEIDLTPGPTKLFINGSQDLNGCYDSLQLSPFEFRAYVPVEWFIPPPPMITKFLPGHDTAILSNGSTTSVNISFRFSVEMSCDQVSSAIEINSTTETGITGRIDPSTIVCANLTASESDIPPYVGAVASAWAWSATVIDLSDGVHQITVRNATTSDLGSFTQSVDHFLIRVGTAGNPIVFPTSGNYSSTLLSSDSNGTLWISQQAPGADMWRYSLNWASTWSDWAAYTPGNVTLDPQPWSGTSQQGWNGHHVIVQYWSRLLGSSSFVQHGDAGYSGTQRRFPHIFANGPFNQFGFDSGLKNGLSQMADGQWQWHYMDEWPGLVQLNVWGINPDGQPDQTFIYGDIDGDFVLDRLPPSSLAPTVINVTSGPPAPYLAYQLVLDDSTLNYRLQPQGNRWLQLVLFSMLWSLPVVSGCLAVFVFMGSFYKVKVVEKGVGRSKHTLVGVLNQPVRMVRQGIIAAKSHQREASAADTAVGGTVGMGELLQRRRTVLIATIEYNIDDWAIKVKIGGLGVMAQLMGKALGHQDLVWVVPCVGDIEYPDNPEERAEPMEIQIFEKPYQVGVHYHRLGNITYVLLDAPIFRHQTKAEPYPPRMDNIDSAIYYSAWNQCIAQAIQRFPIDIYHINDYHGGLAMLYLLPKRTIPCCLSLHNAEFQGLWPLRTPDEVKEVCGIFNLPVEIVQQYVQFGSVFNLLHSAASYLRIHQAGYGAVGVSKKYGDRSFARYPIFWGLPQIGQLPNPDPSDMEEWSENTKRPKNIEIDTDLEQSRGEQRRQAQEWAGLEVDPTAELFVFVGRWSQQKGVDLIADVFPSILEEYPKSQLICIGPTIDLYGKFAALKLAKLMELYPKRVFSKPEFTQLPPYIFSGAEFSLIPSRDEPFGLVAVEFGRKGALGIGARVGGLGQMPGWWYTIESSSTTHLIRQFRQAIAAALESKPADRALMRAWSAKQRFPVAQWLAGLEKLQSTSIKRHAKMKHRLTSGNRLTLSMAADRRRMTMASTNSGAEDPNGPPTSPLPLPPTLGGSMLRPGSRGSLAPSLPSPSRPGTRDGSDVESVVDTDGEGPSPDPSRFLSVLGGSSPRDSLRGGVTISQTSSVVDLESIVGSRKDFKLQQVDPFFTDSDGKFFAQFEKRLGNLKADNSISQLCIEEYLIKSEREWYVRYHDAKVGTLGLGFSSKASLLPGSKKSVDEKQPSKETGRRLEREEFGLAEDYLQPTGLKKLLQLRVGNWPVYSILLALGQIIASNSYQITLLTGAIGESADKLYIVASIYLASSIVWGVMSRTTKCIYPLSLPWAFYGLAFLLIGVSPFLQGAKRGWMENVATGLYAVGSSSGAVFFAFNFGDEGGAPISMWIWRACVIQGLQQIYTVMLWFWGSLVTAQYSYGGQNANSITALPYLFPVTLVIALLLWLVGIALYLGLPTYYRQSPDVVPSLYTSLLRRRTTLWFFVAVILQNYFLASPYGRNWLYLFSSQHVPAWATLALTAFFFLVVWAGFLLAVARLSVRHPWWLPLFALGLGAPRWAQMFWATSGYGLYLPWAGSPLASALLGRALWLWLGLLDTVQNAGIGMMLMLTLTRLHVFVTVLVAQIIGSAVTILARATAPNSVGPGDVFPDLSEGVGAALSKVWFWVALLAQLIVCAGFFKFFRKEQISKP